MDLPKNVTRVGQANSHCKIYVEDYVMTYLKQMNTLARDKEMAIALYGIRREEESVSYIFVYGAGRIHSLQRETRHLSQAQNQEIEKIRKQYFSDYRFIGYRLLNGDMIDGMHICEQGICRYVEGYAQFYEKNDLMLAYMLSSRENEVEPERVNREKYNAEEQKREIVRKQYQQSKNRSNTEKTSRNVLYGQMKVAVVVAFAVLCVIGVASVKGSNEPETLQAMSDKILDKLSEDKILIDDKILETNENTDEQTVETETVQQDEVVESSESVQQSEVVESVEVAQQKEAMVQPIAYTIQQGDNLIAISVKIYGDDSMVDAICQLNGIDNADDIKIGQKILLP